MEENADFSIGPVYGHINIFLFIDSARWKKRPREKTMKMEQKLIAYAKLLYLNI